MTIMSQKRRPEMRRRWHSLAAVVLAAALLVSPTAGAQPDAWDGPGEGDLASGLLRSALEHLQAPSEDLQASALSLVILLSGTRGASDLLLDQALEEARALQVIEERLRTNPSARVRALAEMARESIRSRLGFDEVDAGRVVDVAADEVVLLPLSDRGIGWLRLSPAKDMEYGLFVSGMVEAGATVFARDLATVVGRFHIAGDTVQWLPPEVSTRAAYVRLRTDVSMTDGSLQVELATRPPVPDLPSGGGAEITFDQPYRVRIRDMSETVSVSLPAKAGDYLAVETGELAGGLDTILQVNHPAGFFLEDDDGGYEELASRAAWLALDDGPYEVTVQSYGETSGSCVVLFTAEPGAFAVRETQIAAPEADQAPFVPTTSEAGLVVLELPADASSGWIATDAKAGQVLHLRSPGPVEVLGPDGYRLPHLAPEMMPPSSAADELLPVRTALLALAGGRHVIRVYRAGAAHRTPVEIALGDTELPRPSTVTASETPQGAEPIDKETLLAPEGVLLEMGRGVGARHIAFEAASGDLMAFYTGALEPGAEVMRLDVGRMEDGEFVPLAASVEEAPPVADPMLEPEEAPVVVQDGRRSMTWSCEEDGTYVLRVAHVGNDTSAGRIHLVATRTIAYDGFHIGDRVILGRHTPLADGTLNWNEDMSEYVGREAVIVSLEGTDGPGSYVVHVDIDGGDWWWRTRDMKRPE